MANGFSLNGKAILIKQATQYGLGGIGIVLTILLLTGYLKSPITEASAEHTVLSTNQDTIMRSFDQLVKISRATCLNMADGKQEIDLCNQ